MPIKPTYPGVYVQEVPSGVKTIVGVSTSIAAFVGKAGRGPINKAVRIQSYSDYERRFGGLAADSEMSYAVRQFFMNEGSDAWVVRVAKDAVAASKTLQNDSGDDVLTITAVDEGKTGNDIEVWIDYLANNPASNFNLILNYIPKDNAPGSLTETFIDLSMNSNDARYVEDMVNGISRLVKVQRVHDLTGLGNGTSTSGQIGDVSTLLDPTHNRMRISVNGSEPVDIQIDLPADVTGADAAAKLTTLCTAIRGKVIAKANGNTALSGFTCAPNGDNDRIVMTSGEAGEFSTVRVLPGVSNDAAGRLKLGTIYGGIEADAAAEIRPKEIPDHGTLTSGTLANANLTGPPALPSAGHQRFQISIDGYGPDNVDIGSGAPAGTTLLEKLQDIASRIETAVRNIKPSKASYKDFTCTVTASPRKLVLSSGSRGNGSSVVVTQIAGDNLAAGLKLLANIDGAAVVQPNNETLEGGNESSFTDAEAYNIYIASRLERKGIYALESVDLFNLLCLPAVTDSGILADAESYCKERRSFMIIDAPFNSRTPSEMSTTISGTALPKSDHGAVYYPWIKIADPLKGGKLRPSAPCGTIAGLYARIDSSRGVWKAPAGTEATLTGVQGVEYLLTDQENGTLNPLGVNCIRVFPVHGALAWGGRTLQGADQMASEWKYIPVRRLALFIEESLYRGLKWVVFEPNAEPLWAQIRLNVGAFMHNLFRQGAFKGETPKDAYFVRCDSETTTQNDINLGIVNIWVGFAPLKPAEFVILYLQQMAGQIET
jgi:phage tail sheath protein FI